MENELDVNASNEIEPISPLLKWIFMILLAPILALGIKTLAVCLEAPSIELRQEQAISHEIQVRDSQTAQATLSTEAQSKQSSSITCTDILSAGIGLAIACFADVSASIHKKKINYSILIFATGLFSLVVFCLSIGPEIRNTIYTVHWIFTWVITAINAFCCWRFSYITGVKKTSNTTTCHDSVAHSNGVSHE